MTDDDKQTQDGFDLLEYPCDFAFKAMCEVCEIDGSASLYVQNLVLQHVTESALREVRSSRSRTGRFESVTITVELAEREQLEQIYRTLSESMPIRMTL